jgi:hypothetical protein
MTCFPQGSPLLVRAQYIPWLSGTGPKLPALQCPRPTVLTGLRDQTSHSAESRFVYSEVNIKMTVLWDVAPCSLVEFYQRFRGDYCLHHQAVMMEEVKLLWNVGKLLPDYTAQHPRRQPSSYSSPWGHEISRSCIIHMQCKWDYI